MRSVFVSPHDDDHALFGAFTCLAVRPLVVVVFDGHNQSNRGLPVTAATRIRETQDACRALGVEHVRLCLRDDREWHPAKIRSRMGEVLGGFANVDHWYLPAEEEKGNVQHNLVASVLPARGGYTHYMTYTEAGKSTSSREVKIESGAWIAAKLRALACYESQMNLDPRMGCWPHFMRGLSEYYAV